MAPLAKPVEQGPLRILVIGDPHERPGSSERSRSRWRAAARFAIRQRPDVIIWIGDHWDMSALTKDAKSRGGAGKSAKVKQYTGTQDLEAGRRAILDFLDEIARYNRRKSRDSRKWAVYKPRLVFCLGNHEMRINESGGGVPEWTDAIDVRPMIVDWLVSKGFEVFPFLEPVEINGVFFAHYYESGLMGKAVAIGNAMRQIGRSAVWGHTHAMGYLERQIPDRLGGGWDKWLCVPTFKDPDHLNHGETSGLILLDDVWRGNFTFSTISTDRLIASYDGPFDGPFA